MRADAVAAVESAVRAMFQRAIGAPLHSFTTVATIAPAQTAAAAAAAVFHDSAKTAVEPAAPRSSTAGSKDARRCLGRRGVPENAADVPIQSVMMLSLHLRCPRRPPLLQPNQPLRLPLLLVDADLPC